MYKNTNCFHLAIPCGDLETAIEDVDLGDFVDIEETFYNDLPPYAFGNDE